MNQIRDYVNDRFYNEVCQFRISSLIYSLMKRKIIIVSEIIKI